MHTCLSRHFILLHALISVLLCSGCFRAAPPLEEDEIPIEAVVATPTPTPVATPFAPNNSPLIMQMANLTIDELTNYMTLGFRIFDFDDDVRCDQIVPESDNQYSIQTTAIPTTNQTALVWGDIAITGGESTRCGIAISTRYASASPVKISLSLSDGKGTTVSTFLVNVRSTNTAPRVQVVGQYSLSLDEDDVSGKSILLPEFTDDTPRGSPHALRYDVVAYPVKGTLSNWPGNPEAGGQSLSFYPLANANGSDSFSYRVCDNDPGVSKCSDVQTVNMTINPVNDAPTISSIATQNTTEAIPLIVPFTVGDVDGPLECNATRLSYVSDNTPLVPASGGVSFAGTWPNCTATIIPENLKSGAVHLTFTITDGYASASTPFQLNVAGINHAPSMNDITNLPSASEDSTFTVNFTVDDMDGNYSCNSTYLSYRTGNASIVPSSNAVTWGGTWPACQGTVTPAADKNGNVTLTFIVTDPGGLSAEKSFTINIANVNDAPTGTITCNSKTNANVVMAGRSGSSNWTVNCSGVTDIDGDTPTYRMELDSQVNVSGITCPNLYTATNGSFSSSFATGSNYGSCLYKVKACDSQPLCAGPTSYLIEINNYQLSITAPGKPSLSSACVVSTSATFNSSANISSLNYSASVGVSGVSAQTGSNPSSPFAFQHTILDSFLIASPPVKDSAQSSTKANFQITSASFLNGVGAGASITASQDSSTYSIERKLETMKVRTLADHSNTISESSVNLDGYQPEYEKTSNVCRLCTGKLASISAANNHSCLIDGATLRCWGGNSSGQLGTGNTTTFNFPQAISIASFTPLLVGAGSDFTCTLGTVSSAKEVRCAGSNTYGQLGRSSGATNSFSTAVSFSGRTPVAVSAAKFGHFACALVNDTSASSEGSVYCWGRNDAGQLGNGSTVTPSPTGTVVGLSAGSVSGGNQKFFALAAGGRHACAIQQHSGSNTVYCWGGGTAGQLGNGADANSSLPVAVDSTQLGSSALQVATGASHSCALRDGGDVYCWGDNSVGQLGLGNTLSSNIPAQVSGLGLPALQITAGANHTCALLNDFTVKCWGLGIAGQLGVGSVATSDGSADDCNTASGVANVTFCKKSPTLLSFPSPLGLSGTNAPTLAVISAGDSHSCAMSIEGISYCWGENSSGQLGNSSNTQVSSPGYICPSTQKCQASSTFNSPRPRMCSRYQIP